MSTPTTLKWRTLGMESPGDQYATFPGGYWLTGPNQPIAHAAGEGSDWFLAFVIYGRDHTEAGGARWRHHNEKNAKRFAQHTHTMTPTEDPHMTTTGTHTVPSARINPGEANRQTHTAATTRAATAAVTVTPNHATTPRFTIGQDVTVGGDPTPFTAQVVGYTYTPAPIGDWSVTLIGTDPTDTQTYEVRVMVRERWLEATTVS